MTYEKALKRAERVGVSKAENWSLWQLFARAWRAFTPSTQRWSLLERKSSTWTPSRLRGWPNPIP